MTRKLIALLTLASLAACASAPGPRNQSEQRTAMFEQIVFSQEYDASRSRFLAKWSGPLRIALKGKTAPAHRASVKAHATRLSRLTDLDIALAARGKPANVTIFFASLDDMEKLAGPRIKDKRKVIDILLTSGCLFFYDTDAKYRISQASIFVRTGRSANDIEACLLEEMTQILGLPNDSDLIKPSVFNNGDALVQLTPLDEAFIRVLYDPKMTIGAPAREALPIAAGLLQKNGP